MTDPIATLVERSILNREVPGSIPGRIKVLFFSFVFVCLSVCLFVCLSVCLFVCLSVCLFVCLSVCLFACLLVSFFVSFFVSLFLCLFNVKAIRQKQEIEKKKKGKVHT